MNQQPTVVDGVGYNPVERGGCDGCAAKGPDNVRTALCHLLGGNQVRRCFQPSVIWLTDTDFAVHRLTQGENNEV